MRHQFHQLDVFTAVPTRGNPVAFVHAADDVHEMEMAAFARWTNPSETNCCVTLDLQDPERR